MTIKSVLFILFLCLCLIWVGAAYLHPGPEFLSFGLRWTAWLLIATLVLIIGGRLFGSWRQWRAKAGLRPAPRPKPAPIVHEDDAALAALIADANAALIKAPNYSAQRGKAPLSGLPLYLLIGPEGSGKTTTFINSGLEPQLLAGQAGGSAPVSTRLCNIWLAKNAVFAEISGRMFSGDLGRWSGLLSVLRGKVSVPFWRRLWREPNEGLTLHGVIGFCDVRELTGAAADPQRLERGCRDWQERLRAVGEVFGVEFPVYQVFTKCDRVPFFPDFFARLPESEVNQILGCTLPIRKFDSARSGEAFAEAEAKRLTAAFRPLYHSLAERRLSHLAHEPNPARKPGIYEFPRELKRIRAPLVQFLTDVFRPHPLRPVPVLRGFYLTAVQEVEIAIGKPVANEGDWTSPNLSLETTRLFRGDATQIFSADDPDRGGQPRGPKGMKNRWIFASDLFHQIVLADRPQLQRAAPGDARFETYRRAVFAAICGVCVLLCTAFINSWNQNRVLLHEVEDAGHSADILKHGDLATLADLRSLDALRLKVEELESGESWSYHWGLYRGYAILDDAKRAYFGRFQRLLLNDLNGVIVGQLRSLSATPAPNDPDEPAYDELKTHRTISSGACKPDPKLVSRTLKAANVQLAAATDPMWQVLANRQIDFYASALSEGNPCHVTEDTGARDRARRYLLGIKGTERIYRGILTEAGTSLGKPQRLEDLASNYKQVLTSKAEVGPAFTQAGWVYVQKASKKATAGGLGESCVIGNNEGVVSELKQDDEVAKTIQGYFIRDYIEQWRAYVAGFSVVPYRNPADAAQKLSILADHKSPLLALFALTADQTSFSGQAESGIVAKLQQGADNLLKKGEKKAGQFAPTQADAPHTLNTSDITQAFQPVHSVVAPGSETWVVDKNSAYVSALTQLGHSMQEIAALNSPDAAVYQNAGQNATKALDAAKQLESGFKPVGVGGLDVEVQRLLEEPIRLTSNFIQVDIAKAGANKINSELAVLCGHIKGTLRKFPFQSKAVEDTTLDEFSNAFAPTTGAIWRFSAGALAEYAVKEGSQWKSKDPAKKPQITPEMLEFLGKAQSITDAFFATGAPQPRLNFALRPNLIPEFGESRFELEINGTSYLWTDALQKPFTWPFAPNAANSGAVARIKATVTYAFDSHRGPWGLFRIFADAEPRPLLGKTVEWKYSLLTDGSKDPILPGPVKIDIAQFPGGADVFNPRFYDGLQCPVRAVQ